MATPEQNELSEAIEAASDTSSLFTALYLLESALLSGESDASLLGQERRASDNPIRVHQRPTLSFRGSDIHSVHRTETGKIEVESYAGALFGPFGALPLHITELAIDQRASGDVFARFVNLFQHRYFANLYQAWKAGSPERSTRADGADYDTSIGRLIGFGDPSHREHDPLGFGHRSAFAPQICRAEGSSESLEQILGNLLGLSADVTEYLAEWIHLPGNDRCYLGRPAETSKLGLGAVIGVQLLQADTRFAVSLGPLTARQFQSFCPHTDAGLGQLRQVEWAVVGHLGDGMSWNLTLNLEPEALPDCQLGRAGCLGWDAWLGGETGHRQVTIAHERISKTYWETDR